KFSAVFGSESLTLSQAYYFGTARKIETEDGALIDGTPVRVEVIDGEFVDIALASEMDKWMTEESEIARSQGTRLKNTPPADRDEVELALSFIVKDDYHTWLHVGAALNEEFGEDGFGLFDAWSAKSEKYNARDTLRKWEDCKEITSYSIGTVFYHANEESP